MVDPSKVNIGGNENLIKIYLKIDNYLHVEWAANIRLSEKFPESGLLFWNQEPILSEHCSYGRDGMIVSNL